MYTVALARGGAVGGGVKQVFSYLAMAYAKRDRPTLREVAEAADVSIFVSGHSVMACLLHADLAKPQKSFACKRYQDSLHSR